VAHGSPAKLAPTIVQSAEQELEGLVKMKPDGEASKRKTVGTRSFVRQVPTFGSRGDATGSDDEGTVKGGCRKVSE